MAVDGTTSPTNESGLTELVSGDVVAVRTIRISRIPHASVVAGPDADIDPVVVSLQDAETLLRELHHLQTALHPGIETGRGVSLEFRWTSVPMQAQVHRASIDLEIVLRVLHGDAASALEAMRDLLAVTVASLASAGYDFEVVDRGEATRRAASDIGSRTVALVRDEWLETTGNTSFPEVFAYDRLPLVEHNLGRIAAALVEYPNTTLSVQVVPTMFTRSEKFALEDHALRLGALASGVHDPGIGTLRYHVADVRSRTYTYYADNKDGPLFLSNVLVRGDDEARAVVCARLRSHLTQGHDDPFAARFIDITDIDAKGASLAAAGPWRILDHVLTDTRDAGLWSGPAGQQLEPLRRLPLVMTAEEISRIARLPIADRQLGAGFEVNYTERRSRNYSHGVVGSSEITAGHLTGSSRRVTIGFGLRDLTKHLFVAGTPGSGKTTFNIGVIRQLWEDHGIPTLIIEPAKTEYRALIDQIPDLQVFTPGKSNISPFVFNPFLPPSGVRLETYKSVLRTAFAAGLTMSSPLDRIFDEAVGRTYARYGWLDEHTPETGGQVFSMLDFVHTFRETFERIGYTGDARNIGRAGLVRLQSLVDLFDTERSVPIEHLLERPTVLELGAIENAEQKALLIALVLLGTLSYVNANVAGDGRLKHVVLLEEAHVLLDADTRASNSGDANPTAIAQQLIKRLLAEARSYGLALMVADQSPRKVSSDVVALTGIKVGFRLVEAEDRDIFAGSTNLSASQRDRLGRLRPGEAFLFYDQLEEPEAIVTPDARASHGIRVFVDDDELAERTRYWSDHPELAVPFAACELLPSWDVTLAPTARQIARHLFEENLHPDSDDIAALEDVFRSLRRLIVAALPASVESSHRLVLMVALYLLRFVKNLSRIPISDRRIEVTLQRLGEMS